MQDKRALYFQQPCPTPTKQAHDGLQVVYPILLENGELALPALIALPSTFKITTSVCAFAIQDAFEKLPLFTATDLNTAKKT